MAVINQRVFMPRATVINGVQCGGTVTTRITAGYDNVYRSSPDGLQVAVVDRECQYVRGTIMFEDWIDAVQVMLGVPSDLVFYERKSATAAATGYIKHTLVNPVVHRIRLAINKGGWAGVTADFECRFPTEAATINDVWSITDAQAAPTYIAAARGGWRIAAATHGAADIAHLMSLSFDIAVPILKACNDADVGYTAIDADLESGLTTSGNLGFQDSTVTTTQLMANQLLVAPAANLAATIIQSAGATSKIITIARAQFGSNQASGSGREYSQYGLPFEVSNNPASPLTLDGETNKIITIADAA